MARKRAWWKKISIRSITGGLGKAFQFLSGGLSAAEQPPPQPIVIQGGTGAGLNTNTLLVVGGIVAAVFVLVLVTKD
jgi:hypothetical protein